MHTHKKPQRSIKKNNNKGCPYFRNRLYAQMQNTMYIRQYSRIIAFSHTTNNGTLTNI